MARHRRFSMEFKRQVVLDFLEQRMGLLELARKRAPNTAKASSPAIT